MNSGVARLAEIDETTGGVLRFDGERRRGVRDQLQRRRRRGVSHRRNQGAAACQSGVRVRRGPGLRADGRRQDDAQAIGKRDQFAPELLYFSDCILEESRARAVRREGLQDVRIVQALYESAETGKVVQIPRSRRASDPPENSASRDRESASQFSSRSKAQAKNERQPSTCGLL